MLVQANPGTNNRVFDPRREQVSERMAESFTDRIVSIEDARMTGETKCPAEEVQPGAQNGRLFTAAPTMISFFGENAAGQTWRFDYLRVSP